jgi:hypothetical protein
MIMVTTTGAAGCGVDGWPEVIVMGMGKDCPPGFPGGQDFCDAGGYLVMVSVSRVTAAVRASALPLMVTPVVTVIEARAMMLPLKVE